MVPYRVVHGETEVLRVVRSNPAHRQSAVNALSAGKNPQKPAVNREKYVLSRLTKRARPIILTLAINELPVSLFPGETIRGRRKERWSALVWNAGVALSPR